VRTTNEAAREIELSTKQQSSAVEQVNRGVADVAQAARETEVTSAQMLETVSQLARLSTELSLLTQARTVA
jgi:methyl-accepting chemotaxis protein